MAALLGIAPARDAAATVACPPWSFQVGPYTVTPKERRDTNCQATDYELVAKDGRIVAQLPQASMSPARYQLRGDSLFWLTFSRGGGDWSMELLDLKSGRTRSIHTPHQDISDYVVSPQADFVAILDSHWALYLLEVASGATHAVLGRHRGDSQFVMSWETNQALGPEVPSRFARFGTRLLGWSRDGRDLWLFLSREAGRPFIRRRGSLESSPSSREVATLTRFEAPPSKESLGEVSNHPASWPR